MDKSSAINVNEQTAYHNMHIDHYVSEHDILKLPVSVVSDVLWLW